MRRLLKYLGIFIGLLLILVIGAALLLPQVIDPNQYKDQIIAQVKEQTGRELEINQDIGLSLFPWIGAELGGLRLHNPEGFGREPFMAVEQVSVKVKLLPLLSKQVEVSRIVLDGAQINLQVDENGRTNWDDLASAADETAPEESAAKAADAPPPLQDLRINGIDITHAQLTWNDASSGQSADIKNLEITTGEIRLGEPVDLRVRFSASNQAPQVDAEFELTTTVAFAPDIKQLSLKGLVLELSATGQAIGGSAATRLAANIEAGLNQPPTLKLSDLSLDATLDRPDLKAQAKLTGAIASDQSAGLLRSEALRLEAELSGHAIPGADPVSITLSTGLEAAMDGSRVALDPIKLDAAPLQLSGRLSALKLTESPEFSGGFTVPPTDLRALAARFGIELPPTADPKVLKSFQLSLELNGTQTGEGLQLEISPLSATLDDSKLNGKAGVKGEHISFDLELDQLDADRYLPPAGSGQDAPAAGEPAAENAELIPADALRGLNIAGAIRIGAFTVAQVKMNQIRLDLTAKDGKIALDQQIGGFYQGRLDGRFELNVAGDTPQITLTEKLARFQVGPLLADATGSDTLTGSALFNTDLRTAGNSIPAFKQALNGNLDFRFENGAVKGFNLAKFIRDAKARIKGQPIPETDQPAQTDFTELSGSATITDGVLTNRDLTAKSPFLRVTGDGSINLVQETLNYTVTALIVNTSQGQGGAGLQELVGIPIPIRLSESWTAPKFSINWEKILTEAAKEKVKDKAEEAIQRKIQEKLGGGSGSQSGSSGNPLEGAIRGLFR